MIKRCPYYYKDELKENVLITFDYCHKPKDSKECPDNRMDNECIVLVLEIENAVWNIDAFEE